MTSKVTMIKAKALDAINSDELTGMFSMLCGDTIDPNLDCGKSLEIIADKLNAVTTSFANISTAISAIDSILSTCGLKCYGLIPLHEKLDLILRNTTTDSFNPIAEYNKFKKYPETTYVLTLASNVQQSCLMRMQSNLKFAKYATITNKKFNLTKDISEAMNEIENVALTRLNDFYTLYDGSDLSRSISPRKKKAILKFLRNIHESGCDIKRCFDTPDIDAGVMFEKIEELIKKSGDEFKNCERAFDILGENKDLFKKNFNKYMKSMGRSGSPHTLITEYLKDITDNMDSGEGISADIGTKDLIQLKTLSRKIYKKFNDPKMSSNPQVSKKRNEVKKMMDGLMTKLEIFDSINLNDNEDEIETFEL